jgi:hypothetical protein
LGELSTFLLDRIVACSDCLTTFARSWIVLHFLACCLKVVASKLNKMLIYLVFKVQFWRWGFAFRLFPSRATSLYYINTTEGVKGLGKIFFNCLKLAQYMDLEEIKIPGGGVGES